MTRPCKLRAAEGAPAFLSRRCDEEFEYALINVHFLVGAVENSLKAAVAGQEIRFACGNGNGAGGYIAPALLLEGDHKL